MFQSARIKLTAWYLLIIMLISIAFSVVIFRMLSDELDRVARAQRIRIQHNFFNLQPIDPNFIVIDPDLIAETKGRILIFLTGIDLIIMGSSAIAGYFLAGRTLRPIQTMVDEQNEFITNASHELRTPLTSLKAELEVNLRNKKLTLGEARKIFQSNLEEVNNLQTLSDGLIKMTQYQNGRTPIPMSHISWETLATDAVKKTAKLAKQKYININTVMNDISFEGNNQMLTELLVILLDNAIKYSREKTAIELRAEKANDHVAIHIKDQGFGIHESDVPHIFNRFYRAEKSRSKTDTTGYGLGLAIAKQIIDSHNGTVKVESVFGVGTEFIIQLPLKQNLRLT
jgi:two-component system sensor histidine kinase CiaH